MSVYTRSYRLPKVQHHCLNTVQHLQLLIFLKVMYWLLAPQSLFRGLDQLLFHLLGHKRRPWGVLEDESYDDGDGTKPNFTVTLGHAWYWNSGKELLKYTSQYSQYTRVSHQLLLHYYILFHLPHPHPHPHKCQHHLPPLSKPEEWLL